MELPKIAEPEKVDAIEHPLNSKHGGHLLLSKEDEHLLTEHSFSRNEKGYCRTTTDGTKTVSVQRMIRSDAGPREKVDHINHDPLDCRRENLRVVTTGQNAENVPKRKGLTTTFKGVHLDSARSKKGINAYVAKLTHQKKAHHIGVYKTAKEAATQYDLYIVTHNKDLPAQEKMHHPLNFPDNIKDYEQSKFEKQVTKTQKQTKYHGVSKNRERYCASVRTTRQIAISYHNTEIEAAKAWDKYVVTNNLYQKKGLNFPEDYPDFHPIEVKTVKINCEPCIDDETKVRLIFKGCNDLKMFIDKEDYDKIKYFYPWIKKEDQKNRYLTIKVGVDTVGIHRYLMNVKDPDIWVDHIDRNPFNNCKSNLRLSNAVLNPRNVTKRSGTQSKYLGVSITNYKTSVGAKTTFCATLSGMYIGSHPTDEEFVARWRDLHVFKTHGEMHGFNLNFKWTDQEIAYWKNRINAEKPGTFS